MTRLIWIPVVIILIGMTKSENGTTHYPPMPIKPAGEVSMDLKRESSFELRSNQVDDLLKLDRGFTDQTCNDPRVTLQPNQMIRVYSSPRTPGTTVYCPIHLQVLSGPGTHLKLMCTSYQVQCNNGDKLGFVEWPNPRTEMCKNTSQILSGTSFNYYTTSSTSAISLVYSITQPSSPMSLGFNCLLKHMGVSSTFTTTSTTTTTASSTTIGATSFPTRTCNGPWITLHPNQIIRVHSSPRTPGTTVYCPIHMRVLTGAGTHLRMACTGYQVPCNNGDLMGFGEYKFPRNELCQNNSQVLSGLVFDYYTRSSTSTRVSLFYYVTQASSSMSAGFDCLIKHMGVAATTTTPTSTTTASTTTTSTTTASTTTAPTTTASTTTASTTTASTTTASTTTTSTTTTSTTTTSTTTTSTTTTSTTTTSTTTTSSTTTDTTTTITAPVGQSCGIPPPLGKIVNGNPAPFGQFGFMARLLIARGTDYFLCGGSVIEKRWVLTAAHCVLNATSVVSQLGCLDKTNCQQYKSDFNIIIHPNYNSDDIRDGFDVALIELTSDITYTQDIWPTCLPSVPPTAGEALIAIGYGKTGDDESSSSVLNMGSITVEPLTTCSNRYGTLSSSVMCASSNPGSICQGDSGSFAGIQRNGRYEVDGISSFTSATSCAGFPFGFAKVYDLLGWISTTLGGI